MLTRIDALFEAYSSASDNSFRMKNILLSDKEKLIKPDYLLDLSVAKTLVNKSQKLFALAIYSEESVIRRAYDMPMEEVKNTMAKLAAEVNYLDPSDIENDAPVSEWIRKEYEACRVRGELTYFWQFQYALLVEIDYLLAQAPDILFSRISEEKWLYSRARVKYTYEAIQALSEYDEEVAVLYKEIQSKPKYSSIEEFDAANRTIEEAKQFRIANKDKFIARRNALLR